MGLPADGRPAAGAAAAGCGCGGRWAAQPARHVLRRDGRRRGERRDGRARFLINSAIYRALRRAYGGQAKYEPQDYIGYSDHRPDITLLLDGALKAFDVKIFDPIGSRLEKLDPRGAFVAFGNTAERADDVVLGRPGRGAPGDGAFDRRTGAGYVAAKKGDYARALDKGVECAPLLVETFGGFGAGLVDALEKAAAWRQNKLTSSEFDETTWAARKWLPFVVQQISVATQLAMAQEIAEALGLSVAADPRAT